VTIEVMAEVAHVLKGVYAMERDKIADALKGSLKLTGCQERDVLNLAPDTFRDRNLDFIHCVLYGCHSVKGYEIATFEKCFSD